MRMRDVARITTKPIDPSAVLKSVLDPSAGGTVIFVGTIRRRNEGRMVESLEYEVYKEMAEKKMEEIESVVRAKWPVEKVTMVHRYGKLKVGEASVAVAVSSEHREEAFEACKFAIDTIKRSLPLWKREELRGGRKAWVKGQPIRA